MAGDEFSTDVPLLLDAVSNELRVALARFPSFNTAHEAYAVLLEEVDELWIEVKRSPSSRDYQQIRLEAVQVAAMAIRLILDCCAPYN